MTTNSKRLDQAMAMAAEYRRYSDLGDVVLAEQVRRTIEELVGQYDADLRFVLPRPVCDAMGLAWNSPARAVAR